MKQPLTNEVHAVATLLLRHRQRIVLAESCTGGLVSAVLARVAGISDAHCGSAVVYRLDTKTQWLGIPASVLADPGAVSETVARMMVQGVLTKTPEATLAASITGHLGPNAPVSQDGLVFIGVGYREGPVVVTRYIVDSQTEIALLPGESQREQRQWAAAALVLKEIETALSVLAQP